MRHPPNGKDSGHGGYGMSVVKCCKSSSSYHWVQGWNSHLKNLGRSMTPGMWPTEPSGNTVGVEWGTFGKLHISLPRPWVWGRIYAVSEHHLIIGFTGQQARNADIPDLGPGTDWTIGGGHQQIQLQESINVENKVSKRECTNQWSLLQRRGRDYASVEVSFSCLT
jgi:hypothetical protein